MPQKLRLREVSPQLICSHSPLSKKENFISMQARSATNANSTTRNGLTATSRTSHISPTSIRKVPAKSKLQLFTLRAPALISLNFSPRRTTSGMCHPSPQFRCTSWRGLVFSTTYCAYPSAYGNLYNIPTKSLLDLVLALHQADTAEIYAAHSL